MVLFERLLGEFDKRLLRISQSSGGECLEAGFAFGLHLLHAGEFAGVALFPLAHCGGLRGGGRLGGFSAQAQRVALGAQRVREAGVGFDFAVLGWRRRGGSRSQSRWRRWRRRSGSGRADVRVQRADLGRPVEGHRCVFVRRFAASMTLVNTTDQVVDVSLDPPEGGLRCRRRCSAGEKTNVVRLAGYSAIWSPAVRRWRRSSRSPSTQRIRRRVQGGREQIVTAVIPLGRSGDLFGARSNVRRLALITASLPLVHGSVRANPTETATGRSTGGATHAATWRASGCCWALAACTVEKTPRSNGAGDLRDTGERSRRC